MNSEITIREAVAGDVDALVRLHALFMDHHADRDPRFKVRPGASGAWRERLAAAVDDPETLVPVAVVGSDCVGCAFTLIRPGAMDFGPERIGYLCDVFVEPEFRRRGLARRFLDLSVDWLRERDIHTVEASWAIGSREARSTWPRLGFVPMSTSGRLEF